MRLGSFVVVAVCVAGLAVAAPQFATDETMLDSVLNEGEAPTTDYGPVEGSYFRAGSYDRYTGAGWERTASAASAGTLEPPPSRSDRVRITYEAQAPVRTLPAPWKPAAYDGPKAADFAGTLVPVEPLAAGDEFTVTSRRPVWTREELRTAGTEYPGAVDRYTRLPSSSRGDIEAVASNVTAGAETPYAKAVAVNRWLRTTKNYSLSVDRPEGDIATAFATEMDAGYCQYFATTMAAMLRAEGVPARYVTGYTPYERVGASEHVVRGKYAHTWVEVYFPEVGWVPFDPTPPAEREAARGPTTTVAGEESAVRSAPRRSTRQETEAAGWRRLDADIDVDGEFVPGAELTVTVEDDGDPVPGAQVRFNGRPVGETDADGRVRATAPYRETLRVAAYVYEGAGDPPPVVRDSSGAGDGADSDSVRDLRYAAPETEVSGSLLGLSDTVLFRATVEEGSIARRGPAVSASDSGQEAAALGASPRRETTTHALDARRQQAYTLNTSVDVTVRTDGTVRPGDAVVVEATIEDRPVPNATVTAGEATATTDDEGIATVAAPYERHAEIVVERGDARGTATVPVDGSLVLSVDDTGVAGEASSVRVELDDGTPVPNATVTNGVETATTNAEGRTTVPAPYRRRGRLTAQRGEFSAAEGVDVTVPNATVTLPEQSPGRSTRLRATVGDVPLRNAPVRVDGERAGRTDGFGRERITVPYTAAVTVVVERGDARAERTVQLPTNVTVRTDGPALPGGTVTVRATLDGRPLENATVFLGDERVARTDPAGETRLDVPLAAATLDVRVERGSASGSAPDRSPWRYWLVPFGVLASGAAAVYRWGIPDVPVDHTTLLALAAAGVASLVATVESVLATRDAGATDAPDADTSDSPPGFLSEPATENAVYRAWASLAAGIEGTHETPSAVAESAIEVGAPREAVEELTTLFREVRYGGARPTADRERRARDALERIREAVE